MPIVSFGNAQKVSQAREHLNRQEIAQAEAILREILKAEPQHAAAQHLLATVAFRTGHPEEAMKLLQLAVAVEKNNADYWNDLGAVYSALGRLDDATDACERVVTLAPQFADGFYNYGYSLFQTGLIDEALACYKKAVALRPVFPEGHSIFLSSVHVHPNYTGDYILDLHRHWDLTHARPLALSAPHDNDRTPERRLRVGYVSPNFRNHSIGRFFEPLLANHDRTQFEIFLYTDLMRGDALTERMVARGDTWRGTFGQPDVQFADMVRQDRIDILVDLNMHLDGSRLMAFARKPAPVQATYLAYCGTTGLSTMDYRISDAVVDPPDAPAPYVEATVRLPRCGWCYQAPADAAAVIPMPREHVVFGCLNPFSRISPQVLETWARVLQRVSGSRLLMLAPPGRSRQRVTDTMGRHGVSSDRVEFVSHAPQSAYFCTYWRIDVALDPFPHGGGATTCDALWMGLPAVTLRGTRAVGRRGASILSSLDLPQWIAESTDQYVEIAVNLAADRATRRELSLTLRQRMESSPLMDAKGYARDIEAALRDLWRQWCAAPAR